MRTRIGVIQATQMAVRATILHRTIRIPIAADIRNNGHTIRLRSVLMAHRRSVHTVRRSAHMVHRSVRIRRLRNRVPILLLRADLLRLLLRVHTLHPAAAVRRQATAVVEAEVRMEAVVGHTEVEAAITVVDLRTAAASRISIGETEEPARREQALLFGPRKAQLITRIRVL